jgi:hypothetical protein
MVRLVDPALPQLPPGGLARAQRPLVWSVGRTTAHLRHQSGSGLDPARATSVDGSSLATGRARLRFKIQYALSFSWRSHFQSLTYPTVIFV